MNIIIKTAEQIAGIQKASELAIQTIQQLDSAVKAGVTTTELDQICHDFIITHGAIPAPLNYHGFPKSICTSINQVVCHGIPSSKQKLHSGDIINIDITVIKGGFYSDTSVMYMIDPPRVSRACKKLVAATQEALYLGIKEVAPGKHFGDIGYVIQDYAKQNHLSVVKEYCGHGVGLSFHEDPMVTHIGKMHHGPVMQPGMIFTIEPMLNLGTANITVLKDGWTAVTADGQPSAQWEHTVLVTETGYQILTWREEETIAPRG